MRYLFALIAVCTIFIACNKGYEPPIPLLTGLWQENEVPGQSSGFTYRIKFAGDSTFRLRRYIFTDSAAPVNACNGARAQYIQGTYLLDGDQLYLRGNYFDSSFAVQTGDACSGATYFSVQHSIKGSGKNLILDDEAGTYGRITLVPAE